MTTRTHLSSSMFYHLSYRNANRGREGLDECRTPPSIVRAAGGRGHGGSSSRPRDGGEEPNSSIRSNKEPPGRPRFRAAGTVGAVGKTKSMPPAVRACCAIASVAPRRRPRQGGGHAAKEAAHWGGGRAMEEAMSRAALHRGTSSAWPCEQDSVSKAVQAE